MADAADAADPSSKRAFQAQFRRWGFPQKLNPVYADARLAERVRELWSRGLPQREMLRVLGAEGFEVRDRELVRLRARLGLLLRDPRGDGRGLDRDGEEGVEEGGEDEVATGNGPDGMTPENNASDEVATEDQPDETPEYSSRSRRRRRRTRPWAGKPPDPPGPPRFPSETTIDEARVILSLDPATYRALRTAFQRICEETGLVKKTLAGPERWEAAKARLAREVPQLQGRPHDERGRLALDVICTDVTKRMRDGDRRMSLADAKRVLGVDPDEARGLRAAFHRVLARQAVPVRCKSTAGKRWGALMAEWVAGGAAEFLRGEEGSPEYRERWRALDVLATDVMKRVRDERMRRGRRDGPGKAGAVAETGASRGAEADPARGSVQSPVESIMQSPVESMQSPAESIIQSMGSNVQSPAESSVQSPTESSVEGHGAIMGNYDHVSSLPMHLVPSEPMHVSPLPLDPIPSPLLLDGPIRLTNPLLLPEAPFQQPYYLPSVPYSPQPALAIYLRPHSSSTYPTGAQLWVATLSSRSLRELRSAAAGRFEGAVCVGVEGVVRDGEGGGCALGIADDEELGAYLAHLEGATPTFNVTLAWR